MFLERSNFILRFLLFISFLALLLDNFVHVNTKPSIVQLSIQFQQNGLSSGPKLLPVFNVAAGVSQVHGRQWDKCSVDIEYFWMLFANKSGERDGGYVVDDSGNNDRYCSTSTPNIGSGRNGGSFECLGEK